MMEDDGNCLCYGAGDLQMTRWEYSQEQKRPKSQRLDRRTTTRL